MACQLGDQKFGEKNHPKFEKSSQNSSQNKKGQNIFIKAQFKSSKHLHPTSAELLKFRQQNIFSPKN
jgi:hypothetical protein